ncbi:ComF family protein [Psychromicrobium xiongbiense]|uniref:ComF family protein n=1 Tax=Psychromicrobium xiongbiense TaxID=3051184 RepID=UPI00255608D8|nr:phosphoribosyltransferase family protein [Psychromicrobium sp. YIM S02556]
MDLDPTMPVRGHRSPPTSGWAWLVETVCRLLTELSLVVFPMRCVACEAADASLCQDCARHLRQADREPWQASHGAPALQELNGEPLLPVIAAARYGAVVSAVLLGFKQQGRTVLARQLAPALARAVEVAVQELCLPPDHACPAPVLVPIPTTGAAFRRRGYDPVALILAEPAIRHLGLDAVRLLRPRWRPAWARHSQKLLGRAARGRNARGSLAVRSHQIPRLRGRPIVLIDDVLTTGATLAEAHRVLSATGCEVLGGAVVAAVSGAVSAGGAAWEPDIPKTQENPSRDLRDS